MPKRGGKNKNYQKNKNYNGGGGGGGLVKQQHFKGSYHKDNRTRYIAPHLITDDLDVNLENNYNDRRDQQQSYSKKGKKFIKKFGDVAVQRDNPQQKKISIGDTDETKRKEMLPTQLHCRLAGVPDDVFNVIVKFLQDYFTCYDNNRDGLLAAYNPKVLFSLAVNTSNSNAHRVFKFDDYIKESRNLKRVFATDDYYLEKRYKLLHQGHIDTVNVLRKLPQTEHDPSTFKLDHCYFSPNMVTFSVVGIFKEGKPTDKVRPLRSFQRVFVCIPDVNTGMSIVNEQYTIGNISTHQYKNFYRPEGSSSVASSSQASSSTSSVQPDASILQNLTPEQKDLITRFSADSKLNFKWSHDCLQQANWNYDAAGQLYSQFKDAIPLDAYNK